MKSPDKQEGENQPPRIPAIRIDDASDEILSGILEVYDRAAFGRVFEDQHGSNLHSLRRLIATGSSGIRLGSRLTNNSKLEIYSCTGNFQEDVIAFGFHANLGSDQGSNVEAEKIKATFRREAAKYLSTRGVLFTAKDLAHY